MGGGPEQCILGIAVVAEASDKRFDNTHKRFPQVGFLEVEGSAAELADGDAAERLAGVGFTCAIDSAALVQAVRSLPEPTLRALGRQRMLPEMHEAEVTRSSIAQLRQMLRGHAVVGLYKSRFRASTGGNLEQSACRIHLDDVKLTELHVRLALFPMLRAGEEAVVLPPRVDEILARYEEFFVDVAAAFPSVCLPPSSDLRQEAVSELALLDFTRRVIKAAQRGAGDDELVFDNVTVWVPRGDKRLVLLPIGCGRGFQYPLGTNDAEGLRGCADDLEASALGAAVVFHGQSVWHQALVGPGHSHEGGSLEGRYLTLSPVCRTHAGALRVRMDCFGSDDEDESPSLFP